MADGKEIASFELAWKPHACLGKVDLIFSDDSTESLSSLTATDFEQVVAVLSMPGTHYYSPERGIQV